MTLAQVLNSIGSAPVLLEEQLTPDNSQIAWRHVEEKIKSSSKYFGRVGAIKLKDNIRLR